jgi:hypothetical protein
VCPTVVKFRDVPDDQQLSCLPFDSPSNVENHLAQIVVTLERLAPVLTQQDCLLLLGELSLLRMLVDRIEADARLRVGQQAKRLGISA